VSSTERSVRHHKLQTDRAISLAYARLSPQPWAQSVFYELLRAARERSPRLLTAPAFDGLHPGVEALFNLAQYSPAHIRSIDAWNGSDASWQGAIGALAQHLVGRYRVPSFLAAAWYAAADPYSEPKRRWFIAHAAGVRFRSLDLPVRMTRRMEHIFLASHDHLSIEAAMRRAELLALSGSDDLVDAVLKTRAGADLARAEFWRTVWRFLVVNGDAIDLAQVGPIIDCVDAIRHEQVAIETPDGIVMRGPAQPSFSMKGRTPRSMARLLRDWHRGLATAGGSLSWQPSNLRPLAFEEARDEPQAAVSWHLTELTTSAALRAEGAVLHHCVGSYSERCARGMSQIWSLRVRSAARLRSVLTVEVDPRRRAIVQARGLRNRPASGKARRLLEAWAEREQLQVRI